MMMMMMTMMAIIMMMMIGTQLHRHQRQDRANLSSMRIGGGSSNYHESISAAAEAIDALAHVVLNLTTVTVARVPGRCLHIVSIEIVLVMAVKSHFKFGT